LASRYAVYHAPREGSVIGRLGRAIVGRSLFDPEAAPGAPKASIYGFHATLAAPFELEGSVAGLMGALARAASLCAPFELGPLELVFFPQGFPALAPQRSPEALMALESSLVRALAPHRRPPGPAGLARRGPLTPRQAELFHKWGYPFVLDQFRYHLALGDAASGPAEMEDKLSELKSVFHEGVLSQGLRLDKIALCLQEGEGRIFKAVEEIPLEGAASALESSEKSL
jgi:hypothetical protein